MQKIDDNSLNSIEKVFTSPYHCAIIALYQNEAYGKIVHVDYMFCHAHTEKGG